MVQLELRKVIYITLNVREIKMEYAIEPQIEGFKIQKLDGKEVERISNVKFIEDSDRFPFPYVCYNFALGDNISCCEDGMEKLIYDYKRINIKKSKKGDIISYHDDIECKGKKQIDVHSIQHFAIIVKTNGRLKGTIVKSKWGLDGIYEGAVDDIPDYYGEIIAIWRKRGK